MGFQEAAERVIHKHSTGLWLGLLAVLTPARGVRGLKEEENGTGSACFGKPLFYSFLSALPLKTSTHLSRQN